jgi:inosine-uridine nucleoside N-ribohydrolase
MAQALQPGLFLIIALALLPLSAAERVIIDTDCGYFGDDGITLVMLLGAPQKFKIEAITTLSGNVWGANADRYVREILPLLKLPQTPPIYRGADTPLRHTPAMASQANKQWGPLEFRGALGEPRPNIPPDTSRPDAVSEIIRRVSAAPNQITIIALGPMTNIANALTRRPDLAAKIKRLVFMGGQYRVPGNASKQAEFNFWFDPEAAALVLRSPIREKIMFGLDVCDKALLDKTGFDAVVKIKTPITARFAQDYGVTYPGFFKNPKATVSLWDALVAAWLLNPKLFGPPETRLLDVDRTFSPSYGKVIDLIRSHAATATPVQMINDVNYPGVYELFRDSLTRNVHHH